MPSFLPVSCLRPILQFYIHQNRIRCLSKYLNAPLYQNKITGKRVLPFASLWVKGRKLDAFPAGKSFSYAEGRFVPASVTIEAALCLPLFFSFLWLFWNRFGGWTGREKFRQQRRSGQKSCASIRIWRAGKRKMGKETRALETKGFQKLPEVTPLRPTEKKQKIRSMRKYKMRRYFYQKQPHLCG